MSNVRRHEAHATSCSNFRSVVDLRIQRCARQSRFRRVAKRRLAAQPLPAKGGSSLVSGVSLPSLLCSHGRVERVLHDARRRSCAKAPAASDSQGTQELGRPHCPIPAGPGCKRGSEFSHGPCRSMGTAHQACTEATLWQARCTNLRQGGTEK